jgi:RNA polymerase sigma-70 factor (ECF subfamily)
LASLDPDQRAVIVLRDIQGLDYDQIAAALGTVVGTVKSRLFRARLALRQSIENPAKPSQTHP